MATSSKLLKINKTPEVFQREVRFLCFVSVALGIVLFATLLLRRKMIFQKMIPVEMQNAIIIDFSFYFFAVGCIFLLLGYFLRTEKASTVYYVAREPVRAAAPIPSTSKTPVSLQSICGIGPVLEKRLNDHGIQTVEQLASIDINTLEQFKKTIPFPGRIYKERWLEQALDLSDKSKKDEKRGA